MAEAPQQCGDSANAQDLLSVALGESGLNLDDLSGVSETTPGNLLSQALFESGIASGIDFWLGDSTAESHNPQVQQFKTQTTINAEHSVAVLPGGRENGSSFFSQEVHHQVPQLSYQPLNTWTQKRLATSTNWALSSSPETLLQQQQTVIQSSVRQILGLNSQQNAPSPLRQELSKSVVSRLWSNQDVHLEESESVAKKPVKEENEEEEEEEEELGHTETYAEYMPSKLRIGIRHPDPVVETSSLSSVAPPDVWYNLHLPAEVINKGFLSALQLEAVVYSCQKHETLLMDGSRAGFLIGDGAGVGKGRTVAGIIYENYLLGRKRAIWLSVSNDLKYDAVRDLRDIGCNISVHSLSKFKYDAKISSKANGKVKKGCVFSTYSSLIGESQGGGKYRSRMAQLLHWCGADFDGVIILDECHKAKNLVPVGSSKPTKTGLKVLELQNKLPKARVVYCSATGASEPKNMAYMSRLGIWGPGTPFREFADFIQAVERRGVGAMEIVAMDMKLRGMYMARQLSFGGVSFDIREVPLTQEFIEMYDASVKLWKDARDKFEKAADMMEADSRMKKTMWGQFWSAHQRFFKYLCIASKVKTAVTIAKEAVERRKCIVIGLQSTGEARTLEQLEECGGELTDFVSTAKGVFSALVEKHFPAPDRQKMFDLFGFDMDNDSGSSRSSPVPSRKRRKGGKHKGAKKKLKPEDELERIFNGSDSGEDSDEDKLPDNKQETEADDSSGAESDSNSDENEEDDFNPFDGGSTDEDDPWLTRSDRKKKQKNKSGTNTPELEDPSVSALAAAGLKVSTPSWSRTSSSSSLAGLTKKVNSMSWKQSRSQSTNNLSSLASKLAQVPSNSGRESSSVSLREMYPDTSKSTLASLLSTSTNHNSTLPSSEKCMAMKKELLDKAEILGSHLPPNTLDELIDELGGADSVAEMTGRKGRVVSNIDGTISYESRSKTDVPLELLNIAEKKRFMDGEKNIAVISEAASSGISLQADRRAQNQRRRVHITLELPWSADRAIQQFGRTHRSNQVSAPEYLFLISELAGERRFASIVAKRLESLGALTHGDRRATESRDLSRFNIDNKYGRTALEVVLKSVMGHVQPMVAPPTDYKGNFFHDIRLSLVGVGLIIKDDKYGNSMLDKDYTNISRFLNRILGVEVELQNRLFAYFCETLNAVIQQAKRSGRYDEGILDLGSAGEAVNLLKTQCFMGSSDTNTAPTELHTVSVERGLSWDQAKELYDNQSEGEDGFYISSQVRNNKRIAILVKGISGQKKKLYSVFRPNTGLQIKQESIENIKKKYSKADVAVAKQYWDDQYNSSATQCSHAYWRGNCKRQALNLSCEVGLRQRTYHILSGSVLSVWSKLESVLAGQPGTNKIQIIRVRTVEGTRIVGSLIPGNCVPALERTLNPDSTPQPQKVYHFDDIL